MHYHIAQCFLIRTHITILRTDSCPKALLPEFTHQPITPPMFQDLSNSFTLSALNCFAPCSTTTKAHSPSSSCDVSSGIVAWICILSDTKTGSSIKFGYSQNRVPYNFLTLSPTFSTKAVSTDVNKTKLWSQIHTDALCPAVIPAKSFYFGSRKKLGF